MMKATLMAIMSLLVLLSSFARAQLGVFDKPGTLPKGGTWIHPHDDVSDIRRVEPVHDVITPHIPLVRPLHGGPVRVLAITGRKSGRWPLELKQRLDVDLAVVYTQTETQLAPGPDSPAQSEADVSARLLQALNRRPEVIVSAVKFEVFPKDVQARLLDRIAAGVGYVGYLEGIDLDGYRRRRDAQRSIFASAVPFAGLRRLAADYEGPTQAAEQAFALYEKDQGSRMAAIWAYPRDDAPPETSRLVHDWMPLMEEEAWNSFLARTLLWCARRDAGGLAVEMPARPVARGDLPMAIEADVQRPGANSRVELAVFDQDARERHKAEVTVKGGRAELAFPVLPAGDYFVLVRLWEGQAVRDWSLQSRKVTSDIAIAGIELKSRILEHEAEARASIQLTAAPEDGSTLTVECLDNFGRVVHRETMPAAERVDVSVPTAGSLHLYNYVNVLLTDSLGDVVSETRESFVIRHPALPTDDLVVLMWGGPNFHPEARKIIWKHAQDGVDIAAGDHEHLAHYNMWGRRWASNILRGFTPSASLLNRAIGEVKKTAERWAGYPLYHYVLGDDTRFPENWTAEAIAHLAVWAKERYGALDALNEAWGTDYGDFSEVRPIEQGDAVALALAAGGADYGGLCRWVDQQLAREDMVVDFISTLRDETRRIDPRTPLAFQNLVFYPTYNAGGDLWRLAQAFDAVGDYPNPIKHDIYRSARAEGSRHSIYSGGYGVYNYYPYYAMELYPWWSVFHNLNALNYYIGGWETDFNRRVLAPDLGPLYGYEKSLEGIRELKAGVARMLFNAERRNDGVAVLYSPGSVNATAFITPLPVDAKFHMGVDGLPPADPASIIPPLPKPPQWDNVHAGDDRYVYMNNWEAFTALLKDVGLNYDVVSEELVEDGFLIRNKFRMLVLPLTLRVPDGMVRAIREFVREGGVVLADFAPGVFDGRMRPGAPGVLADVFGVAYAGGLPRMAWGEASVETDKWKGLGEEAGAFVSGLSALGSVLSLENVALEGADALARGGDGAPLLMVHEYGRGKVILFNMLARDYQIWRTLADEFPFRQSVAGALSWAGMTPRVEGWIHDARAGRRPLPATEKVRFVDGDAEYIGLLRDAQLRYDDIIHMSDLRPHPTVIDFGREAHVYDVRRRLYRGYRREMEEMIYPARAELYALLPYEVSGLETETAYPPGEGRLDLRARLTTAGGERPGRHVFRLEVTGPDGRQRRAHDENCLVEGGELKKSILLGYNADPGTWQLKVRDVASGASRIVRFTVDK